MGHICNVSIAIYRERSCSHYEGHMNCEYECICIFGWAYPIL